jgi:hypothetical protein
MEKQHSTQKTTNADGILCPAEGRVDVAEGVEEEQRNAYSTHHPSQEGATRKRQQAGGEQGTRAPLSREDLPPVEGRVDVASDLEEEQRNAYSAHHH